MEKVNILVVGAGVVGLSIGKALSSCFSDIVIVDKEDSFGKGTSSRNSEVIHSGIYYPHNSLKATLCVRGNKLLYEYATVHNIPCKKTEKLVVASAEKELPSLQELFANGVRNRVPDLKILDKESCFSLEPKIKALRALQVPSTGIIDTHKLMKTLGDEIDEKEGFLIYGMEAVDIENDSSGYIVSFSNGEQIKCNYLINSAGLHADKIAAMAGVDIGLEDLKLHWCKGEYYKTTRIKGVNRLIYPLPDPEGISLGIHLTLNLNNEIRFGPSAYYVDSLNYGMDEKHKNEFLNAINKYIDVEADDIHPDDTGIRPKLQAEGEPVRDFYIAEETKNGLPNLINLIGIESPGLTAAPAIGEYVVKLISS